MLHQIYTIEDYKRDVTNEMNEEIEKREAIIEDMQALLDNKDSQIREKDSQIDHLQATIAALRKKLE